MLQYRRQIGSVRRMAYKTGLLDIADHIATITLNRPEAYNSFTRDMTNEFVEIWKRLREDEDVRVIILRAEPSTAFCTRCYNKCGPDRKSDGVGKRVSIQVDLSG